MNMPQYINFCLTVDGAFRWRSTAWCLCSPPLLAGSDEKLGEGSDRKVGEGSDR